MNGFDAGDALWTKASASCEHLTFRAKKMPPQTGLISIGFLTANMPRLRR
jgi:hypothetical protein